MQSLKIRKYQSKDKDIVWQLHEEGLKVINTKPIRGSFADKDVEDVEDGYLLKGGEFLVVEIDGEVIAMGAFRKEDSETVEIKRMRVRPDFRRQGIGQIILKELEKRAAKMGYKKAILETSNNNKNAISFYLKNGYQFLKKADLQMRNTVYHVNYYQKDL